MDKRGLRSSIGGPKVVDSDVIKLMNFLTYADGKLDLIDIAQIIGIKYSEAINIAKILLEHNLIRTYN